MTRPLAPSPDPSAAGRESLTALASSSVEDDADVWVWKRLYEKSVSHRAELQRENRRLREALERIYQQGRGPHVEIARQALND